MKKYFVFFIIIAFIAIGTTACTNGGTSKPNMIQSKRRFENYVNSDHQKIPNSIDLSEGPRQNYDAKFGPSSLEFDIKIVDPYKY